VSTTPQLNDTSSPGLFLNTLDTQLAAMAKQTGRLPEALRDQAKPAVANVRHDLLQVTSHAELHTLAARYAKPEPGIDPVTAALRAKVVEQVGSYLRENTALAAQRNAPSVTETSTPARTQQPDIRHTDTPNTIATQPPAPEPLRPPTLGVQPRDLVVIRNGEDQKRWAVVDRKHTNGTYVVRISGQPTVVPAISITHIIDPKKQPDLPIDSIIERGTVLPVARVNWGDDAERLAQLAKGQPSMRRLPSAMDNFDLRDGIGTSNERAPKANAHLIAADQRNDQQPENVYVRNASRQQDTVRFKDRDDTVQRLPTAGPQAMRRSAELDNQPTGQTRILVTGSPNLGPEAAQTIKAALAREIGSADPATFTVVHGASKGADELAHKAARELGMRVEPFRADWKTHGNAAGGIRNQDMLNSGASKVLAFVDKPIDHIRGAADLVGRARNSGIPAVITNTAPALTQQNVTPTPQPPAARLAR
jgi:hypothetical protein